MKKFFLVAAMVSAVTVNATAQQVKILNKVLELQMPAGGGANGASVAWHPIQKKYYASMAGNINYPFGVFDITGKLLSDTSLKAMFDNRGLWYNPGPKTIQMNGYNDFGWGEYKLDDGGMPVDVGILHENMNQPGEQSAGSFDPTGKVVYFFNEQGNLDKYRFEDAKFEESITLHLGLTGEGEPGDNGTVINQYNSSTALFTGIKNAEIALLNYGNLTIELYDISTGYMTRKLKLPEDTKIPPPRWLNFAYCNGIYWVFDRDTRIWTGFR